MQTDPAGRSNWVRLHRTIRNSAADAGRSRHRVRVLPGPDESPMRSAARMQQVTSSPPDQATRGVAWSGLLLLCSAGIVWGTIGPAVAVVHEWSPLSVLTIGAYRSVAAVAALALAATATRRWGACRALIEEHRWRVVLTGVLTAAFQLLFFVAVVETGVSVTTVVALGFAPVLLLVVASVRGRQPPSLAQALTVATAVVGLFLVTASGADIADAPHPVWGVLAA